MEAWGFALREEAMLQTLTEEVWSLSDEWTEFDSKVQFKNVSE
jgi:hypothetical protein